MSALTNATALWVYFFLLLVFFSIGIVLVFVFESKYKSIVKNEGALCPSANCKFSSQQCQYTPFKYDPKATSTNGIVCAPPPLENAPTVSTTA
jgi:hypothetical protein